MEVFLQGLVTSRKLDSIVGGSKHFMHCYRNARHAMFPTKLSIEIIFSVLGVVETLFTSSSVAVSVSRCKQSNKEYSDFAENLSRWRKG